MSSSALNLGILQAKISNIQNAADSSTVYSGGVWSFKNSSAVTSVTISNAGVVTIGPSIANNYTGKAHVISGGLTSGNVTSTNASGRLYITNNCNIFDHTATSRTDTVTSGSGISLDNGTANGNAAFAVYANLTGDALDADASNIGFATYAGAWTLGPGSGSATTSHVAYNRTTTEASAVLQIVKGAAGTTTSNKLIVFGVNNGGTGSGGIGANGTDAAAFTTSSDVRLKKNIIPLSNELNKILQLNPVSFDYISGGGNIGFIAQEMENVYPDAVGQDSETGMFHIGGWDKTTARLVKAIQELSAKVDFQDREIRRLKGEVVEEPAAPAPVVEPAPASTVEQFQSVAQPESQSASEEQSVVQPEPESQSAPQPEPESQSAPQPEPESQSAPQPEPTAPTEGA